MEGIPDATPHALDTRTKWGRTRFGRRRVAALWVAVPAGVSVAVAIGAGVALAGGAGPDPIVTALTITLLTMWACIALAWALVVDRTTLRGATEDPEQSVEARWYERAASGAFSDTVLIAGLGTAVIAFTRVDPPALLILVAVLVVAMGSASVRYLVQQRRG